MIKTTPMIFNREMVRALLAGNKTQTRRLVPEWQLPIKTSGDGRYMSIAQRGRWGFGVFGATPEAAMNNYNPEFRSCCPFGWVGDLIYVRETFNISENELDDIRADYLISYVADDSFEPVFATTDNSGYLAKSLLKEGNTPSIHMPRWASRLTLKIADVRVERIQVISEDDAWAEGVDRDCVLNIPTSDAASAEFSRLWENVYPDSWDKNEWVWVMDFEVINKNVDLVLAEMEQAA